MSGNGRGGAFYLLKRATLTEAKWSARVANNLCMLLSHSCLGSRAAARFQILV